MLLWNKYWSESFESDRIKNPDLCLTVNVHVYYEKWVKKSNRTDSNLKFSYGQMQFKGNLRLSEVIWGNIVAKTDILQKKILAKK